MSSFIEIYHLFSVNANVQDLNLELDPALPKPTALQVEQLRQLFLVGSACNLAAKYDLPVDGLPAKDRRRLKHAYNVNIVFLFAIIFLSVMCLTPFCTAY